jgi:dihydrofolate reductase
MRKIVAQIFVSLDGVMQAPGGPDEDPTGGFDYGGWVFHYFDDESGAAVGEAFGKPFDLLLGRKTYDIFAAYWPYVPDDHPIGNPFNAVTKYVATRSDRKLTWNNSRTLGHDVVAALRDLKQQDGPDLLIQGSSNFVQTLLTHDLIDEFRLFIFPLLLGKGKRLFGNGTVPAALKLTGSKPFPSGVIMATYEPAGEVKKGSFTLENPSEDEIERRKNLD